MGNIRAVLDIFGGRQYRALQDRYEALQDEHIALLQKQIEVTKGTIALQDALQEVIDLSKVSMALQKQLDQQNTEEKRLLQLIAESVH